MCSTTQSDFSDSGDDSEHLMVLSGKKSNIESFALECDSIDDRKDTSTFTLPLLERFDHSSNEQSTDAQFVARKHSRTDEPCAEPPSRKRPRLRPSNWRTQDVSVHDRKSAWVDAYGDVRVAKCMVCQFNEVGWHNVGFDMAHVVARNCGGNNDESWNRVPTCGTCNKNVSSETNLLDFVAEFYPKRLVVVARYLWNRFQHRNCFVASKHFAGRGLEAFVRTMYGCCGVEAPPDSMLAKFLRRKIGASEENGLIQNKQVYRILRHYDEQRAALADNSASIKRLNKEIGALDLVYDRLRSLKAQEVERRKQIKRNIANHLIESDL